MSWWMTLKNKALNRTISEMEGTRAAALIWSSCFDSLGMMLGTNLCFCPLSTAKQTLQNGGQL